jgi:dTMP kinase
MAFVVFEGLDGTGKSSLMSELSNYLIDRGVRVVRTREPGGTRLGDQIRELILRHSDGAPTARTELLLYEASRAQHVDLVIRPALNDGQWVLCDRFTASSIAFQAGGRDIPLPWVEKLNEFATRGLTPDLTILLDLSVSESRRRRQNRDGQVTAEDRIESESDSFHEKVRQAFLTQAAQDPEHWMILDASKTMADLKIELIQSLGRLKAWTPNA